MCPSFGGIWTSSLAPYHCSCMQWAVIPTHGQWWWPATAFHKILSEAMGRLIFKFILLSFLSALWSWVSIILICRFPLRSPSRLPIIQGGTFTFLTPTLAMLSLPTWKCSAWTQNATLVNASSPEFIQVWQTRMREVYYLFSATCSVSGLFAFSKVPGPVMTTTAAETSIPNEPWSSCCCSFLSIYSLSKKLLNRGHGDFLVWFMVPAKSPLVQSDPFSIKHG